MHLGEKNIEVNILQVFFRGRFYSEKLFLPVPDGASPRERRKLVLIAVSPFRIKFKSKDGEVTSKDEVLFRSKPVHGFFFTFLKIILRHSYRLLAY